ncbi:type II toxin-antitoxin system PemK/MazF family toxin [Arthrobacter sp. ISL-30]|uniref:type II toxin-antitoxin system PemK/MazF family toxin n=1 Tax=Arthrobacter sp. ISL-30 TaxID=2819109 RepID=UPI001BE52603|nr:type II toxin-antitoxin system PemK/MazF family toxin [Arthrobacter sp. ISL-30]MBT2512756.1 type II toxin-antitoxin system PemK/MazF family toxin [Arthrobacter sp. ISL-30]
MPLDFSSFRKLLRRSLRLLESPPRPSKVPARAGVTGPGGTYPGDFAGRTSVRYSPELDGNPDPGEIVWTWVPFEEDHTQGKDRPVLLVGHDQSWLLGVMLTSKDHDNGHSRNEDYVDIGAGAWDPQRRPSEAKLDRIIRVDPSRVRREGAILDKEHFQVVTRHLKARHGWS